MVKPISSSAILRNEERVSQNRAFSAVRRRRKCRRARIYQSECRGKSRRLTQANFPTRCRKICPRFWKTKLFKNRPRLPQSTSNGKTQLKCGRSHAKHARQFLNLRAWLHPRIFGGSTPPKMPRFRRNPSPTRISPPKIPANQALLAKTRQPTEQF